MINSKNELLELFKKYTYTQREYVNQFLLQPNEENWDANRLVYYSNGIVLGKFREGDTETLEVLKEGVTDQALFNEIKIYLKYQIKIYEEQSPIDCIYQEQLDEYKKQLNELSCNSIDNWIDKHCVWILNYVMEIPRSEVRVLLYLYYSFDNYKHQNEYMFCGETYELEEVYKNVLDKQSSFFKYGIVSIDDERELLAINPPRIYDKTLDRTFFTKNVPLNLLKIIANMISCRLIKDFAVRLFNEPGYNGKLDCEYVAEELERGKKFDFANLGDYSISRLYSTEYENCMWVVIDQQNVTFEELCKDFEIYNDMIVTQVIHLQYDKEEDRAYITHLDHEYIFYTIDEYDKRMSNATQKGTAKARIKSFKIDNSRIPFDYRCEVLRKDQNGNDLPSQDEQFLCYVLECYFKHKDLLKEYFQEV